jgi:hypothetical protein
MYLFSIILNHLFYENHMYHTWRKLLMCSFTWCTQKLWGSIHNFARAKNVMTKVRMPIIYVQSLIESYYAVNYQFWLKMWYVVAILTSCYMAPRWAESDNKCSRTDEKCEYIISDILHRRKVGLYWPEIVVPARVRVRGWVGGTDPNGYQIGMSAGTTIEGHNAYLESIQFTI